MSLRQTCLESITDQRSAQTLEFITKKQTESCFGVFQTGEKMLSLKSWQTAVLENRMRRVSRMKERWRENLNCWALSFCCAAAPPAGGAVSQLWGPGEAEAWLYLCYGAFKHDIEINVRHKWTTFLNYLTINKPPNYTKYFFLLTLWNNFSILFNNLLKTKNLPFLKLLR